MRLWMYLPLALVLLACGSARDDDRYPLTGDPPRPPDNRYPLPGDPPRPPSAGSRPPSAASLSVTVVPESARATVLVDGAPRGSAPLAIEVTPGTHEILVQAAGYATAVRSVEVAGLEPTQVEIVLAPASAIGAPLPQGNVVQLEE